MKFVKHEIRKTNSEKTIQAADFLKQLLSTSLPLSMDLAQEKGSSVWLISLPIQEFGFALHKQAFRDALALRYNWQPLQVPSTCACEVKFSIEHAQRWFSSIRHNEIKDLTSNLLSEICNDVFIEAGLQPIDGEILIVECSNSQDVAKLDTAASGFCSSRFQCTFFNVLVFNPHAPSNNHAPRMLQRHEKEK